MRRILIAHGYWGRGGAEVATMQLIDAIKNEFQVFLITRGGFELQELNMVSQTEIKEGAIQLVHLPLAKLMQNTRCGAIWNALFLRYCRHIGKQYDICITASRTIGWGRPAFHFLSDVVWNDELEQRLGENIPHKGIIQKVLFYLGLRIAGKARFELNPADVFVTNSHWTAEQSAPYTPTAPIVIYPAVTTAFELVPWEARSTRFVSIGRISPEKQLEDAIAILESVRERGFEVGLTIYGVFDQDSYSQSILQLCQERDWIDTPGAIYAEHKLKALPSFKYGINTCGREAFGISTAEMINAGIIPFVSSNGAQIEIVDTTSLVFNSNEEAVVKIITLLNSKQNQIRILNLLEDRRTMFSKEKFQEKVLELINQSL